VILLSDPKIAAIPLSDNGEALVDLRQVAELRVDDRQADDAGAYALVREGVLERLLAAQNALPDGIRLLIIEAYRPLDLQRSIFDGYREELRQSHPEWDEDRLHVEASKYVSPPEVAPHSTGGTVDLTLCRLNGRVDGRSNGAAGWVELDMGTEVNANPEVSRNACYTASPAISGEGRRNRDLLASALTSVGMVNYPTEWWHWSYGDRYWALMTAADSTVYGPVHQPAPDRAAGRIPTR
jgi:zinc D-Ala-D-Ala dipeptidase